MHKREQTIKQKRLQAANRVTWYGLIANVVLTIFKLFAGISGHSAAMIADAIHSLSDLFTDFITFLGVAMGAKPDNRRYNYGHGKFETMASLIISFFLIAVAIGICWEGMTKIIHVAQGGTIEAPGIIALAAAAVAVLVKELIYRLTIRVAKRINSPTLEANAWHHRTDSFSSIGVMFGIGGAILLGEKFYILDPIAAIIVSLFIGRVGVKLAWTAACELMERSLPEETECQITHIVESVNGLQGVHSLRTRRIGCNIAVDLHVLVDAAMSVLDAHNRVEMSEELLKKKFGNDTYISIHIEPLESVNSGQ